MQPYRSSFEWRVGRGCRMIRVAVGLFIAFFISSLMGANAAGLAEIEAAYQAGAFEDAAGLAEHQNTAAALVLGARALIARATLTDNLDVRDAAVDRAIELAGRVVAADAYNVEAHLQLAIALGLKGRGLGPIRAHFKGLAGEARGHIDLAQQLTPESPWPYALLGAWHLEISHRGGRVAARTIYGATREKGLGAYDQALVLGPENLVLHYQYALALMSLSPDIYQDKALVALAVVLELPTDGFLQTALHARAVRLVAAIEAGDRAALATLIVELRGHYETPKELW